MGVQLIQMTLSQAVAHLILSSTFKTYCICEPPEGDKYRMFKHKFEQQTLIPKECMKMLADFNYKRDFLNNIKPPNGRI